MVGVSGINPMVPAAFFYVNNKMGGFTLTPNSITPVYQACMDTGDYNGDSYPDILVCGANSASDTTGQCSIYLNNKNLTFTNINAGLEG